MGCSPHSQAGAIVRRYKRTGGSALRMNTLRKPYDWPRTMKNNPSRLWRCYATLLHGYMRPAMLVRLRPAKNLGQQALSLGFERVETPHPCSSQLAATNLPLQRGITHRQRSDWTRPARSRFPLHENERL